MSLVLALKYKDGIATEVTVLTKKIKKILLRFKSWKLAFGLEVLWNKTLRSLSRVSAKNQTKKVFNINFLGDDSV